ARKNALDLAGAFFFFAAELFATAMNAPDGGGGTDPCTPNIGNARKTVKKTDFSTSQSVAAYCLANLSHDRCHASLTPLTVP
ncbi:MAG: hypothetical protein WEC54_07715, partial [Gemmatimonadales bacterium]